MATRKPISDSVQAEVLVRCRRRCCICFGLNRDEREKKGQIAHLDRDSSNSDISNLAFLCFDHHDEYDSKTSQSKGLRQEEVARYRDEVAYRFSSWATSVKRDELLNFLAFRIDIDQMVDSAIAAAATVVWYSEQLALDVLTQDAVDYCDMDLYLPYIAVLDQFASWGWLTHSEEERAVEDDDMPRVFITVKRNPVCDDVAARLRERIGQNRLPTENTSGISDR